MKKLLVVIALIFAPIEAFAQPQGQVKLPPVELRPFSLAGGGTVNGPILFPDGTKTAPAVTWKTDPTSGRFVISAGNFGESVSGVPKYRWDATRFTLASDLSLVWRDNADVSLGNPDLFLTRDAANTLAQRNGTNAQAFRLYRTIAGSDVEYLRFSAGATAFRIDTIAGGAGVARPLILGTNSTDYFEIGTTGQLTQGSAAGAATTTTRIVKKVTGIADNSATTVFTVTVPNANHAASIALRFLSSNGSTDAFESSRTAEGTVVLTRTTGVTTVAAAVAISDAAIATVAAGATHTLAYSVTAMTGAAGATQTFNIQVTIDDSGNLGSNQVVALAEVLNAEASGVTIQ